MTESDVALVRLKLVALMSHLQELRTYVAVDSATYLTRPGCRRASERMVQIVVECATDIAEAIVEAAGRPPPPTARAAFEELRSTGVLEESLAALFGRRYVGLRNRIVHDYEEIDDARVQEGGQKLLEDAGRFGRAVSAWVDRETQSGTSPS